MKGEYVTGVQSFWTTNFLSSIFTGQAFRKLAWLGGVHVRILIGFSDSTSSVKSVALFNPMPSLKTQSRPRVILMVLYPSSPARVNGQAAESLTEIQVDQIASDRVVCFLTNPFWYAPDPIISFTRPPPPPHSSLTFNLSSTPSGSNSISPFSNTRACFNSSLFSLRITSGVCFFAIENN